MPPLLPGDPGDAHGEDRHDEDDVGHVPPLPPEDRLWRHPSEVASGRAAVGRAAVATTRARPRLDRRTGTLMVLAGMAGATLAVGAVGVLGGFDARVVEREVAVRTSMVGQSVDDGVEAIAARTGPSVAALLVHRSDEQTRASAVALRSDGYLVTDGPAVEGADEIDVALHGGWAGVARLVGIDDVTGIAVLHVDADVDGALLADDRHGVPIGAHAIAVSASPDGGWDPAVATGFVSAVDRRLDSPHGAARHGMILLDTRFSSAAAGGALVDRAGVVVGILSGMQATIDGAVFGVATPIDLVRHVADQIIEHGRATHVWIGLHGTDLEVDDAMARGLTGGALVQDAEGPAADAGIVPGDVVLSVDGEPVPTMSALIAALRRHLPGDVVELGVHRDGRTRTVQVRLAPKR
ncbi:MAG: S1C family serine protease [Acidimicrobiia bacterium]